MNKKLLVLIIIVPLVAVIALLLIPPYLEWEGKAQSLPDERMRESFYKIRDSCLTPDWMDHHLVLYEFTNSTHVINNNTCEWKKIPDEELEYYQKLYPELIFDTGNP